MKGYFKKWLSRYVGSSLGDHCPLAQPNRSA
jgi:hypothetical protein